MKPAVYFKSLFLSTLIMLISISGQSRTPAVSIKEEAVTYTDNGITLKGVVAYDSNIKGKRPAIIIIPEWWGMNDYIKMRARKLAELGYVAMAADVFGEGRIAADPKEAQAMTTPFYQDPHLAKSRLDAAIKKIKEFAQADPSNVAAIGYCFGGFVVLNSAELGSDLKGVVSFHGGLGGVPVNKELLKAKILVCQGGSDKFVSMNDYNSLKHRLDSIGADNTFKVYPNATHAFTNPDATRIGKQFNMPIEYNAKADQDSWNDMKSFFLRVFNK